MIPVSLLYGTPEDAAAQMAYLKKRGYPISYVEMGEEPDGQYMLPEDYAALYLQFATAIHRVDPDLNWAARYSKASMKTSRSGPMRKAARHGSAASSTT